MQAAAPTAPTGLLTNGIVSPQAIDNMPPGFSWIMHDADRGEKQTAWQILVSSTPAGRGDIWNSGKTISSTSSSVPYAGPPLIAATRYWWSVKLWDKDGVESPFSAPASFEVGLLKKDWSASYIWDGTDNQNNFAYFRKGFTLGKAIKSAQVFVSAHNDCVLYLNGHELGRGPARSDPRSYGQYVGYDVTSQLTPGANAFAAQAHWLGTWSDSGVNAAPAFILECRLVFADGSQQIIKSDGTWKALPQTPFIETDTAYFGNRNRAAIRYDARNVIPGWTTAAFNDAAWPTAKVVERSNYNLWAQRVTSIIEEPTEVAPVSLAKSGAGWVADFGKCLSGWPQITLRDQAPGKVIRLTYFQLKNGYSNSGWDEYTCKGGTEVWRPNFGREATFKAVRVSGLIGPLKAADIRGIVSHDEADVAGRFDCSNTLINQIYAMCERSSRQNLQQGIISVDANREQSPWTADSHNVGLGLLYNQRNTQIFDKIVRDYAAEQMPDGRFFACSPAETSDIPEWSMYWPMMLRDQYLFSGDQSLVAQMYPNLTKWLAQCNKYQKDTGLIDMPGWRIADYAGGIMENDGQNIALNTLYYENLRIAAQFATLLGHADDATTYTARAQALKAAINTNLFVDGKCYLTKVGSQQRLPLGAAYALRFDIVPDKSRPDVAAWIRTQQVHIGGYGGENFYSGSYSGGGLGDFLVNDLIRYRYMLDGNDTNWESFDHLGPNGEPIGDLQPNHCWTSYPAYIFQRYISGVAPTGPAFSTFTIKPEIDGLTFAQSTVPTRKGDIHTRWQIESPTQVSLTCTVPENTTALICIPVSTLKEATVREGTATVWSGGAFHGAVPGIAYDGADSRFVRLTVGSGTYAFSATGTAAPASNSPVILDNETAGVVFTGSWIHNAESEVDQHFNGSVDYAAPGDGSSRVQFQPNLPWAGKYKVFARWTTNPNRATDATYTVHYAAGSQDVTVDQRQAGGQWNLLGTFNFKAGMDGYVTLNNAANGFVIADAVKFERVP